MLSKQQNEACLQSLPLVIRGKSLLRVSVLLSCLFTLVIIHLICDNQLQISSNFIQFSWFTDNYNLYCSGLDSWIISNLATGSFLRQPVVNLLSTFKSAIFHQTFSVFVRSLLLGSRTSKNPRSKIRHDCPVHAPWTTHCFLTGLSKERGEFLGNRKKYMKA